MTRSIRSMLMAPPTSSDGLTDGLEMSTYHSNPVVADTDGDGFNDGFEVSTGFSPTSEMSTPEGLLSIRTAVEFRFNAATGVSYRIEASTDLTHWDIIEPVIIGESAVVTRFYSIENQPKRFFSSAKELIYSVSQKTFSPPTGPATASFSGHSPIHISQSAIAALTLPLAPSAIRG